MDFRVLLLACAIASAQSCYWNAECPYLLHATKTPYETVRGDIRDYPTPANGDGITDCEAVSIWNINRHGNRNPGSSATASMRVTASLKDDVIASYEAGTSQLCAQDIDLFRRWTWNETLEVSASFLSGAGYEELYGIGKRIRERYPQLLQGTPEKYRLRSTPVQRTLASGAAFLHGLTDGLNLNITLEDSMERDDVIRPYENCDRYQEERAKDTLPNQLEDFFNNPEFVSVKNAVQQRLGISTQLTADDTFNVYELCRFYRSWTEELKSPWCAVFTDEDLIVLEYYDDVRHYYRNGYGSWVNVNLGSSPLKDLYENFEAVVQGSGRNLVSYYTHNAMMEMTFCAMGLYQDSTPLQGSVRDVNRIWRTSFIGVFAVNLIAVLNRCGTPGDQIHRVQFFINEKETALCPLEGCTWQEFQEKFQPFASSNLDFCSLDYEYELPADPGSSVASVNQVWWSLLLTGSIFVMICYR